MSHENNQQLERLDIPTLKCRHCLDKGFTNDGYMWSEKWGNLPYFCENCELGQTKRKAWETDEKTQTALKEYRAKRAHDIKKNSGIVKKFAKFHLSELQDNPGLHNLIADYLDRYKERNGRGLFLWGNIGAGKTATASIVGTEVIERYLEDLIMTNWAEALQLIKDSFDTKAAHPGKTLLQKMRTIPLLILDDMHQEKGSEWVREQLFILINTRYNNGLPTIVTSQFPMEDIADRYGAQIASRLIETSQVVEFTGQDRRQAQKQLF